MGRLNAFEINLANPTGVFYSGNIVEGHVIIELIEQMEIREVKLNFSGSARVDWTETDSNNKSTSYTASEEYFDQDVLLYGNRSESNFMELPQGRHSFPFCFELPLGLPCSFEGFDGHVRYIISCKIDRPRRFDHRIKKPFTVLSTLDLNSDSSYMRRVQNSKEKQLCCLCCKSGPISASFNVERKGFVPGEAIKLFGEISNGSNRKMDKSFVELKMVKTFHATTSTTVGSSVVARVSRPEISSHSEDVWSGEELIIPPLPPSFLQGCSIIDIKYILQLNVDPAGPALDLEVPLEIVIGTIPLLSVVDQHPPTAPTGFDSASPWTSVSLSQPGMAQIPPNLPPPSYSQCITGQVNIKSKDDEHTRGDLLFAPAYTYYNWGNTPGALPEPVAKK